MEKYILTPSCNIERHAATFQASLLSTSHLRPGALGRRVDDDAELSIFDAEHYFDEGRRHDCVKRQPAVALKGVPEVSRDSSVSSADGGRFGRYGLYCSTSWNSHTGLLYNPPRGGSGTVTVRAPKDRRRLPASPGRRLFSRSCPCSGKKSINVHEKYSAPKSPRTARPNMEFASVNTSSSTTCFDAKSQSFGRTETCTKEIKDELGVVEETKTVKITPGNWAKDAGFLDRTAFRFSPEKPLSAEITHRIVSSGRRPFVESFSFPVLNRPQILDEIADEPPRDSLEVFRPREELPFCTRKSLEVQRLAAVLPYSGDAEPHLSISYVSSPAKLRQANDDAASDASSDLFEIESFSTSHGTSTYRRRDSLDELDARRFSGSGPATATSLATSDCYPPSEASVDWSVATADGPDGANAASDARELRHGNTDGDQRRASESAGWRKNVHGGSVLSCRSEKAVHVAPNPVRFVPPVPKRDSGRVNLPIRPR